MDSGGADAAVIADSVADPGLFAALYERHLVPVTVYLARRVGSGLAEDLAAEVFVRAFRGRRSYRAEHQTALPWLLGIANHLVGDHRRGERRRLGALQRLGTLAQDVAHDEVAVLPRDLVRQLRRLPAADRDALLLVVWGELTYEETATALEIPVGTVRSRIARARNRLTAAILVQATSPIVTEAVSEAASEESNV